MFAAIRSATAPAARRAAVRTFSVEAPAGSPSLYKEIGIGLGLGAAAGMIWKIGADMEMKKIDTFYAKLDASRAAKAQA